MFSLPYTRTGTNLRFPVEDSAQHRVRCLPTPQRRVDGLPEGEGPPQSPIGAPECPQDPSPAPGMATARSRAKTPGDVGISRTAEAVSTNHARADSGFLLSARAWYPVGWGSGVFFRTWRKPEKAPMHY